jgi:hypothetical protein
MILMLGPLVEEKDAKKYPIDRNLFGGILPSLSFMSQTVILKIATTYA